MEEKQTSRLTVVAIGSIPLIMTLGNSMLIPILPKIKSELHLSQFQVSLVITVFSVTAAVFIPMLGYLADRFSRKVIIIPCLFLYGAGGILAGFASTTFSNAFFWVLLGRGLQGLGAAGTAPLAMALTGDLFKGSDESRVLGLVEASNGFGKVLSPILGALIALIAWYWVFFAFPVFCIAPIVLTWIFIKEKAKKKDPPPFGKYVKGLVSVFKHEGRWLFTAYLAGAVCLFTLFGIMFYLSDVLEKTYQTDGVKKGLILAIPLLVMCTTSYITGSKIGQDQRLMKKMMIIGLGLITVSYGTLSFFSALIPFISILVISSIGTGFVLPCVNSFITGAVGKERRGFVTSLYGSVRFLGVAIGPPIFGRLMEWSKLGMFLTVSGLSFVAGILVLTMIQIKKEDTTKKGRKDPKKLQPANAR
ncbi:MFS transporter [Bacillus changyiensis]|uniref:MFS transporter n=1 Tax=Bacillus changyiensis TaxID=3004103 RepID=UPI0022DFC904|nr:MFS transporter [Bacillus changyiensis]MDA1475122.1 MFS transporter [Bacillus changyiensis]